MPNLNHINRTPPAGIAQHAPMTLPLLAAAATSGLSRSTIYRAAGEGKIKLLKLGRSTLVDMESVRAFLASLPTATIRAPKQAA